MKKTLLLSSLALAIPVITHYSAGLFNTQEPGVAQAGAPLPAQNLNPRFIEEKPHLNPVIKQQTTPKRSFPRLKSQDSPRNGAVKGVFPAPPDLKPETQDHTDKSSEPGDLKAYQDPFRAPMKERNFSNPMAGRWIPHLSGDKAHLSVTKHSQAQGCHQEFAANCQEIEAQKTAKIVGVVAKTSFPESFATELNGTVKRGHFIDNTPGSFWIRMVLKTILS
jgi:hypothetical protein